MHTRQPFYSLITVVFNDLAGLKETADSIARQDCPDFEWIVIDGGSTDGTPEYIAGLGARVAKWLSEKDTGIYDAMNKGIHLSSGTYTVFMNAGDAFRDRSTLQHVKDRLATRSPRPDVLFGGATLILRNGREVYRSPRDIHAYLWHGLPAYHQATYYLSSRLKSTRYDTAYRICGDYYIVAKLYLQGIQPSYLDRSLVNFRVGDTSYRNPVPLVLEPYTIQRDILRYSLFRRSLSMAKRLFSLAAVAVLSLSLARPVARRVSSQKE